jgi:hypothetical protein
MCFIGKVTSTYNRNGKNFCKSLLAVHSRKSDTYGVKSDGPGCMINVDEDDIKFLWLSENSYRFFNHIACIPVGDGG